jgi:hypothetical protein
MIKNKYLYYFKIYVIFLQIEKCIMNKFYHYEKF